jgi:hypothetical protein
MKIWSIQMFAALSMCACASNPAVLDPPCDRPSVLEGEQDRGVRGFIVTLRDDGKLAPGMIAYDLGRKYGFTPQDVFRSLHAFSVSELSPQVLARLRCEPSVDRVSYIRRIYETGNEPR